MLGAFLPSVPGRARDAHPMIKTSPEVVDFLTKWVSEAKEEASLAYLCNFAARAAVEGQGASCSAAVAMIVRLAEAWEGLAEL